METNQGASGRGRPRVSTPEAVEQASIDLLLQRGYDTVSVDDLAATSEIGRSTFFRYFGSKAAVVWWGFDRSIGQLAASLEAADARVETFEALRAAIRDAVRAGIDDRGVWWERFVLLDTVPALRAEANDRWDRWVTIVASFVARRARLEPEHPRVMAVATAHQAVYLATLRNWTGRPGDPEEMLARMLTSLEDIAPAMQLLLR